MKKCLKCLTCLNDEERNDERMMKKMNEYGSMNAMKEELTAGQKKLPPALQKAIAKKNKDKKERVDEMMRMKP